MVAARSCVRYVRCFICHTPLCWWCCVAGSGCADSPATCDLRSKHRLCLQCVMDVDDPHPLTWSATALDWDFARAHSAFEEEATLVTMDAGGGAVLQWPRFVATFDHMLMRSVVGPPELGIRIAGCSVVLLTPRSMVEHLDLHRLSSSGHRSLLFELSDPDCHVLMVWAGGRPAIRKGIFRIPRASRPWSRWLVVPLTVAMRRAMGDEFLRG